MIAVATAAVREATDGPAFCDQVERETGLQLHVASGSEEARLAAKGVLLGWPDADGLVCDMGGASMELAQLAGGEIHACATSPLGPLQLADIPDAGKREKAIRKGVKALRKAVPGAGAAALPRRRLVAGDRPARHGADRLSAEGAARLRAADPAAPRDAASGSASQDQAAMSAMTGTSTQRLSLIPLASRVLAELVRRIEPERGGGLGLRPARGPALPADARGDARCSTR